MFTYDSQQGRLYKNHKERAYLCGIVSIQIAEQLQDWLNAQNNVIALYTITPQNKSDAKILEKYDKSTISVTYEGRPLIATGSIPIYLHEEPSVYLEELSIYVKGWIERTKEDINHLNKHYVIFSVIDARYGHKVTNTDGLFKKIIQGLKIIQFIRKITATQKL